MKFTKRLGALLVALCLMLTMIPAVSAANATGAITLTIGSATMSVNGSSTTIDAQGSRATIYKTYTMLPIRGVIENMGGTADWNSSTKQVTLKYNGTTVVLTLGSTTAYVNGVKKTMSVAPFTDNGRTYVWLRTVEFFPNVTVNWRADTRQATVVYPMIAGSSLGTNNVALTFRNSADLIFKSIQFAPAGTTSWGTNVLSQNLNWNAVQTVNVKLGKAVYDMMGTDYYGNKFYYRNMDFTNVSNVAVLTLTGGDTFSLVVDGILASGADKKVNLNLYNATGQQITSIVYGPAGSNVWSNELLTTYRLNNGTSINLNLDYSSSSPYYDFRVTYASGLTYTFSGVNLQSQFGTQLIRLNGNGLVTYTNSTTGAVSGDTEITFRNRYSETVDELKMSTSNTATAWKNADNLISTTKKGESDDFDIDLSGVRKWYVRAYDKDGDVISTGSVTFSSTSVKSATITLDRDGDFSLGGSKNSASGDVTAVIANSTKRDVYGMFVLDYDDDSYDDDWDYDDFDDDYDDIGALDPGEASSFDDIEYDSKGRFQLVVFEDKDDFSVESLQFDADADYGLIVLSDSGSSSDPFDMNDQDSEDLDTDEIFLEFYNDTDDTITDIEYRYYGVDGDDDEDWSDWDTLIDSDIKSGNSASQKFDIYEEFDSDYDNEDGEWEFRITYDRGEPVTEEFDLTDADFYAQIVCGTSGADSNYDGE